jgi:hypothetical protein
MFYDHPYRRRRDGMTLKKLNETILLLFPFCAAIALKTLKGCKEVEEKEERMKRVNEIALFPLLCQVQKFPILKW